MTEPLMTDAATTTEGATSQDAAPAAAQAAGVAAAQAADPAASNQQQPAASQTAATDTDSAKGDQTKGDQGDKPPGAPDEYELAVPQGVQMDDASMTAFEELARDLNLTQEAAQKVLDKLGPAMVSKHTEVLAQAKAGWLEASKADAEFGGEKIVENLAVARKALDKFGTPELRTMLNESGLGNHPEIIRAFYRAGKAISEDSFVPATGSGSPKGNGRDYAASLYPNQQT